MNGDWDVLTLQPDLALNSNGLYDALALRAGPSVADPFVVKVVWLGAGMPGAQPFTIHDASFGTIATGQTSQVPEPAAASLLLLSALVFAKRKRPQGTTICNRQTNHTSR